MVEARAGLTPEHINRLRASFGGDVITPDHESYDDARLMALKRDWDPDNVFHLNHNIEP